MDRPAQKPLIFDPEPESINFLGVLGLLKINPIAEQELELFAGFPVGAGGLRLGRHDRGGRQRSMVRSERGSKQLVAIMGG